MDIFKYSQLTSEQVFQEFQSCESGLSLSEAKNRLIEYGRNEVVYHRKIGLEIIWRQIKNPMIYLLFFAALIAVGLKEYIDAAIIFIILVINTTLGFFQEYKAEKILEKLKSYIVAKARVRRQGRVQMINRQDIVPGDLVLIEPGDIIPADLRLAKTHNLTINESILTGESYPVQKTAEMIKEIKEIYEAKNLTFTGSQVVSGRAEGVVLATGKNTIMGEIISLTAATKHRSLFEENIFKLSKLILRLVFLTLTIIFVINLFIKRGAINFEELLLFTIALAISVIPEALPLITTLTLSKGALIMAKKQVVVKRLSAIEDLGSIDVICADKTGTITQNILAVKNIFSSDHEKCLLMGLLTSDYLGGHLKSAVINPFDQAIWQTAPPKIQEEINHYQKVWDYPFDPNRRRNLAVVKGEGQCLLISRGAPEEIIGLSNKILKDGRILDFSDKEKEEEIKKFRGVGKLGQRTLAVAYQNIEENVDYKSLEDKNLIYLGFVAFADPLKPTAKTAVQQARKLGIEIKILTGDAPEVAETITREIGLPDTRKRVFIGAELEKMSRDNFLKAVDQGIVFARVSPLQKYKIIEALEEKYSVAFLGEGINDAPALKLTQVAMVVDGAADVSKEAADIILLKKDLKAIVDGIAEGRKIFVNVIKYVKYTLISNFGNFYAMAVISLFIPFLPMLAVQILLLNLLSDLPLATVAVDRVNIKETSKPQKYNFHEIAFICVFLGLISSFFDFLFFGIFYQFGPEIMRTLWFIASVLTELVIIYSIRTKFFFLKGGMPSLTMVGVGLIAAILAITLPFSKLGPIFHFVAPPFSAILVIIFLTLIYFSVTEIAKLLYFRNKSSSLP